MTEQVKEERNIGVHVELKENGEINITSNLSNRASVAHVLSVGIETLLKDILREQAEELESAPTQDLPDANASN